MNDLPTTLIDLEELIKNEIQESLHLDYKDSRAIDRGKKDEIAKDVSAFANSDGGLLIYGITEENNLPVALDSGIDHSRCSREWLEQVISTNIFPRIEGIRIAVISLSTERSFYAVKVPKSFRGPHQSSDKKYYKRYNFQSVAMEDYEITDVRNRQSITSPLLNIEIEMKHGTIVYLKVANIGNQVAKDLTFEYSQNLKFWIDKESPNIFTRGIKYLPPNKSYSFMYGSYGEVTAEETALPSKFDIAVCYLHPTSGEIIRDEFHFDLMDYWNTQIEESEFFEQTKKLKDGIDKLTTQIEKSNRHFESLTKLSKGTGLNLSVSTLRNLRHLMSGKDQIEKINPYGCNYDVFIEVLGIDIDLAFQLRDFFRRNDPERNLDGVEGMTDSLKEQIYQYFIVNKKK